MAIPWLQATKARGPLTAPANTPDTVSDALLAASARAAERGLSVVRAVFCAAVMARVLGINAEPHTVLPVVGMTGLAIAFSLFVLWRTRRDAPPIGLLTVSVVLDVGICLAALGVNVLWPSRLYPGLLRLPEIAALTGMIVAAGLRGHPRLVLVSMGLACCGLGALTFVDLATNAARTTYNTSDLVTMLLILLAVGSLAALMAVATRRMLRKMGRQTWRGDRAEGSIERLLHEQHDMQAVLSAALIHAQQLSEAEGNPNLQHLVGDLEVLRASTGAMRTLADTELLALKAPARTDLADFLRSTAERLGHLAPAATLTVDLPAGPAWAILSGGRLSALRIFANLIRNAAEGDGKEGAARIRITVTPDEAHTRVSVEDDGPGFADTAKAGGTGVGLASVQNLIAASGGTFDRRNAPNGGAIVAFSLPADAPRG